MKKNILCLIMFCSILCIPGCRQNKPEPIEETEIETVIYDSVLMCLIADTIIYDVIIKNTDPENEWAEKCPAISG